jgi:small conductance mechanosensitive channel
MVDVLGVLRPYLVVAIPLAITLGLTAVVAVLVNGLIGRLMTLSTPQATGGARRLGAIIVWLVGGTLSAQELGLSADVLLLVIALFGAAALIALREPLGNYGAKYFTDLYSPFKVGDVIQVQGFSGQVIEINAMTTVLLTDQEQLVSIPNSLVIREVVVNRSPLAWKEVTTPISLGSNVDLPAFEAELRKSLGKLKSRLDPRFAPLLTTKSQTPQSTELVLTLMLRRPEERDAVTTEANRRVSEVLARARTVRK